MGKGVYSVAEVAGIIHVSIATVNRLLNAGTLEGYRPSENANWKIPRKALLRYMREKNIPLDFLKDEKTKILIIDDEAAVSSLIRRAFQSEKNVEVEEAHSGFQAGLKLESFRPDIILLDIYLGDMNGRELMEHIRGNPEFSDARVIGMSGMVEENEIGEMLKAGFDDFVQKPFNLKDLKGLVMEFAGRH